MKFAQVIAQEEVRGHLIRQARTGHVPHAMLLCGPEGCGKLPTALAYAQYLLCAHPGGDDSCGNCPSCREAAALAHPDLHFVFPVIRYKTAESTVCDIYLEQWRRRLLKSPYFDMDDWLDELGATGQQPLIYAAEAAQMQRKLALKPALGGRKVMVIWQPERMNAECANKLLKLIEEPPAQTHFIMVSHAPEKMLPTILSRLWHIEMKALQREEIVRALAGKYPEEEARRAAQAAGGSYTAALKMLEAAPAEALFLDMFILLMRQAYARHIREMKKWSEQMAAMGRERQKGFLAYCQRMLRENFVYNFRCPGLNGMTQQEEDFARNFARFVNERNVIGMMDELSLAERDIAQNTNPRMVFFDLILKMTVLLLK